jgi:spermidine/putrescine-binding protein
MKHRIAARIAAGVFLAAALLGGSAASASADDVRDLFNYCSYINFNSPLCSDF